MQVADVTTAISGSEPVKTVGVTGAEPVVKDAKADSSTEENVPFDKDPRWKSARLAEKKLQEILKANELDDPDDLVELVKSGRTVKGKITDLDKIDEILFKAAKLDSYEAYWAEQKKKNDRESLDPNERADRLERELEQERSQKRIETAQKKQMEETKHAISQYESEVASHIKEVGIPKVQEAFVLSLFGVNNPSNDVDITDRKAIRKLVQDGLKSKEAYDQSVIESYLAGKKSIVKTGSSSESIGGDRPPRMKLKEARKAFVEHFKAAAGG